MEASNLACAQKKCAAEGRLIVFIDESGLSERPARVRTWAPKGCAPVVQFHLVEACLGHRRDDPDELLVRLHEARSRAHRSWSSSRACMCICGASS